MERHNIFLEVSQLRDLSPSERQVVDFVLQHPEQALEPVSYTHLVLVPMLY